LATSAEPDRPWLLVRDGKAKPRPFPRAGRCLAMHPRLTPPQPGYFNGGPVGPTSPGRSTGPKFSMRPVCQWMREDCATRAQPPWASLCFEPLSICGRISWSHPRGGPRSVWETQRSALFLRCSRQPVGVSQLWAGRVDQVPAALPARALDAAYRGWFSESPDRACVVRPGLGWTSPGGTASISAGLALTAFSVRNPYERHLTIGVYVCAFDAFGIYAHLCL
jgi:hypothetical protein